MQAVGAAAAIAVKCRAGAGGGDLRLRRATLLVPVEEGRASKNINQGETHGTWLFESEVRGFSIW